MGYQPMHGAAAGTSGGGADNLHSHHHNHHQRLHSPRVAGGGSSMTRRANSFKRGGGGEIELQIGSPRSPRCDGLGSPPGDAAEPSTAGLHHHQNSNLRFRLFKRPGSGAGAIDAGLGLGIQERRKLGNVLFLAFCSVCLLLGLGKIWAGGWFALPADDKHADFQKDRCSKIEDQEF